MAGWLANWLVWLWLKIGFWGDPAVIVIVGYGEVAGPSEVGGTPRARNVPDAEQPLLQRRREHKAVIAEKIYSPWQRAL